MTKVLTVIGARPQFIKASPVSKAFAEASDIEEVLVHTGQHFDENMSAIFFDEMGIPEPKYNLDIHSLSHAGMTAKMMMGIEEAVNLEKPDAIMVYGDTNSTLAAALVSSKLHIPLAHVEAGLRSFNMKMPEEINRILTDRVSHLLFCPTETAVRNLEVEGFESFETRIVRTGDVMYDASLQFSKMIEPKERINDLGDIPEKFVLGTIHRAENTDDREVLSHIVSEMNALHREIPVVIPMHPRTSQLIDKHKLQTEFICIEPVGYLDMISLLQGCSLVITDSGGLQKEAYFFDKFCLTIRDQTEWTELVEYGANELIRPADGRIKEIALKALTKTFNVQQGIYGDGNSSQKIVAEIKKYLN